MKEVSLGTSMWGWSVDRRTAFSILDCYYENGGRHVDTAFNYPLNGVPSSRKKSVKFIAEWCERNEISNLKVNVKIGSVTNRFTPKNNLSIAYLVKQFRWASDLFGDNLHCLMVHWDDREDLVKISETCAFLTEVQKSGYEIGISGIRFPQAYKRCLDNNVNTSVNVQVKHNFLQSRIHHYEPLCDIGSRFWAYGILGGGLKLSAEEYRNESNVTLVRDNRYHRSSISDIYLNALQRIIRGANSFNSLYQVAIAYSEMEAQLFGYIIAPSTLSQAHENCSFIKQIHSSEVDVTAVFELSSL